MAETRVKFRTDKSIRLKKRVRRKRFSYLWALLTLFIVSIFTTVLISRALFFKPYDFQVGRPIDQTVRAPFSFEIENAPAYQEKVKEALEKAPRCYLYDSSVEDKIIQTIEDIRETVTDVAFDESRSGGFLQQELKRKQGLNISDEVTTALLSIGNDRRFYESLKAMIHNILSNRGVIHGEEKYTFQTYEKEGLVNVIPEIHRPPTEFEGSRLIEYPEELLREINRSLGVYFPGVQAENLSAANDLAASLVEPNLEYMPERTEEERRKIVDQVKKVTHKFKQDAVIINRSETVNKFHAAALARLNKKIHQANILQFLANFLMVAIVFAFVGFFVHKYRPDMGLTTSNIILISLPGLLALGLSRLMIQILGNGDAMVGYGFPAAMIGILAVVLLDARIAFVLVSCCAFLFGLMVDMDFKVALLAFIGGAMSVSSLYNVRERKEMLMAGFRIALINFIAIIIFEYIDNPMGDLRNYAMYGVWGIGNGIASAFIAFPALTLFEVFFGVVTDVRLLELTGIRQPILSELEEKAPGSYQHSLNVAKLSEPAAIAVGVNYLLVRAGAYYHDIGKSIKPKYYSENQSSPDDKKIYSNITPHMAVLIIKKHIKEGMELARKWGLPQAIIDFIPQHHGTSLIRYFYNEAKKRFEEGKSNDPVREEDFRYPGPKPQSIETAIVMLADSVEATSTSKLSQAYLDEDDIRLIVHESILRQFNDGQFDECNMTLRDVHIIEESFVKTLLSRYHYRVDYPKKEKGSQKEEKKTSKENNR